MKFLEVHESISGLHWPVCLWTSTSLSGFRIIVGVWCGKSPTLFFFKNILVIGPLLFFNMFRISLSCCITSPLGMLNEIASDWVSFAFRAVLTPFPDFAGSPFRSHYGTFLHTVSCVLSCRLSCKGLLFSCSVGSDPL